MIEIMSKSTGINSTSFYGNQSNGKRNERKSKHILTDDYENEVPDKKKSLNGHQRQHIYGTPPSRRLSYSSLNSTEKFYRKNSYPSMKLINSHEVNYVINGFNNKKTFGLNPRNNRSNGGKIGFNFYTNEANLRPNRSIKVDMKSANERTPPLDNCQTSPIQSSPVMKSNEKITHYFSSQPKACSPIQENEYNCEEQNQRSSEGKSSPITLTPEVIDIDKCETPKSWRFGSCDERGVNTRLFNDFDENDIMSETILEPNIPIGLRNLGNTCYMNSIVQSLFALKFFIEDLEIKFNEIVTICEETVDFSTTRTLLSLYNQFEGLRNGDNKCSFEDLSSGLSDLKQCVGQKSNPFLSGCQQDAAEFFNYVIDMIAEEFESTQSEMKNNPIWRNFSFEVGSSLQCQKCQNTTHPANERFNALYLSIPEDNSLQTAFDDFLKDETTGHECTHCSANRNVLSKYFAKRSKVLFLQLARYTQDGSKRTEQVLVPQLIYVNVQSECSEQIIAPSPLATPYRTKLQNVSLSNRVATVVRKISFNDENEENICDENELTNKANDLSNASNGCPQQIIEENSETNVNKSINRVKYQLVAVICHHGMSLSVGHYTCYVYSIENNQWFECDDNRIVKTTFDCVQQNSQMSGYCYFYVLS